MSRETDLAWAAGLFDGEGSIGIYWVKNPTSLGGGCYQLTMTLGMTDEETVEEFHHIIGIGVTKAWPRSKQDPKKWKLMYRWSTGAKQAQRGLRLLLPFLRLKQVQARIAIEFSETFRIRGNRGKSRSLPQTIRDQRRTLAVQLHESPTRCDNGWVEHTMKIATA